MGVFKNIHTVILIAIILSSCQQSFTGKQLHMWVSDEANGLIQRVENENFIWEVHYQPLEYMIAKEAKGKELTKDEYNKIKERKKGLQYFKIKIQSKRTGNILTNSPTMQEVNDARLQYFLNEFDKDILLIDNNDTLVSSLYHFERNYNALNHNNVLIAFKNDSSKTDKKIMFLDRVLGLGLQELTFRKEDIEKTPILKTKTL